MRNYFSFGVKLLYIAIFGGLVWFISFSIFPENQVIKISIGEESPSTFVAPKYIEIVDEEQTDENIAKAVDSVNPIYSINTDLNQTVLNGITSMFLTVIEARTEEVLVSSDQDTVGESTEPVVEVVELNKIQQIEKIASSLLFSTISTANIEVLVEISNYDLLNKTGYLSQLELEAKSLASDILQVGINNDNLNQTRQNLVSNPPYLDLSSELFALIPESRLRSSVAELIAENLTVNQKLEQELWDEQKQKVADSIDPVIIKYFEEDIVVSEGEKINPVQYNALDNFGYLSGESRSIQTAAIPIIFSVFVLIYFLLWRFKDSMWNNNNEFLLLLTLILISSIFLRGISYFSQSLDLNGAVLTVVPSIFLSEDIDRITLRQRIIYITLSQPLVAFGIFFFLRENFSFVEIFVSSLLGGLVGNLAAFSLINYIELAFRLTTNFRLSEIADRNHPGLRYLEEKALGTFNHSLVVGTLGDRAANLIGANSQLVRAMAYFHDLGKTENPSMFVENQFGSSNPHDNLSSNESVEIIRSHVTDGVKLAKKFKIPEAVYRGIIEHHGDSVMRYFYEKEKLTNPEVTKDDFRHLGEKPSSKETVILMFADALEAACRARFQYEDADEEKISNLVNEIFEEKINDGQLLNAPITFQDLEKIKQSFQASLEGLYHQRVLYPEFTKDEEE